MVHHKYIHYRRRCRRPARNASEIKSSGLHITITSDAYAFMESTEDVEEVPGIALVLYYFYCLRFHFFSSCFYGFYLFFLWIIIAFLTYMEIDYNNVNQINHLFLILLDIPYELKLFHSHNQFIHYSPFIFHFYSIVLPWDPWTSRSHKKKHTKMPQKESNNTQPMEPPTKSQRRQRRHRHKFLLDLCDVFNFAGRRLTEMYFHTLCCIGSERNRTHSSRSAHQLQMSPQQQRQLIARPCNVNCIFRCRLFCIRYATTLFPHPPHPSRRSAKSVSVLLYVHHVHEGPMGGRTDSGRVCARVPRPSGRGVRALHQRRHADGQLRESADRLSAEAQRSARQHCAPVSISWVEVGEKWLGVVRQQTIRWPTGWIEVGRLLVRVRVDDERTNVDVVVRPSSTTAIKRLITLRLLYENVCVCSLMYYIAWRDNDNKSQSVFVVNEYEYVSDD